jgi:hypothetical protein
MLTEAAWRSTTQCQCRSSSCSTSHCDSAVTAAAQLPTGGAAATRRSTTQCQCRSSRQLHSKQASCGRNNVHDCQGFCGCAALAACKYNYCLLKVMIMLLN